MSAAAPEFQQYASIVTEDAINTKLKLSDEVRKTAEELERAIIVDPKKYRALSKPMGLAGDILVYEHAEPSLEVTFQIDEQKERVWFYRYTERQLRLSKTIFISYSHNDRIWLRELRRVFDLLEELSEVATWDDEQIKGGEEWKDVLAEKLDKANAAVLLVSDSFLNSEFIKEFELPRILDNEKMRVFWIHLIKSKVAEKEPRILKTQSLSSNMDITLNDHQSLDDKSLDTELWKIARALIHGLSQL